MPCGRPRLRHEGGARVPMLDPAFAVTLLIEIVCGAFGGIAIGRWLPHRGFGKTIDACAGAVGGLVFTWLAARIPGVGRLVGYVETAVDGAVQGAGGITPLVLVGAGIAGLVGGSVLMLLLGLAKRRSSN